MSLYCLILENNLVLENYLGSLVALNLNEYAILGVSYAHTLHVVVNWNLVSVSNDIFYT